MNASTQRIGRHAGERGVVARSASRRNAAADSGRRSGFTLVEILMVTVIIAILAGLISAAAVAATRAARRATIKQEISQLTAALEQYRNKYGEYPPDFTDQEAVVRHLRKAFPRYQLPADSAQAWGQFRRDVISSYRLDVAALDASSALIFWLGGLPAVAVQGSTDGWEPAGFNADPTMPFKTGGPRTTPFFEFDSARLGQNPAETSYAKAGRKDGRTGTYLTYYPRNPSEGAPYVYFRARLSGNVKHYCRVASGATLDGNSPILAWAPTALAEIGVAVPYLDGRAGAKAGEWRENAKFQIISAGLDGVFSGPEPRPGMTMATAPRSRDENGDTRFTQADRDNITNFIGDGASTLEDEK